jgi:ATP synthase protein I
MLRRDNDMAKNKRDFSLERSTESLQQNVSSSGAIAGASYTLVGGIIVLGGLGYGFDYWRGTSPWGLIIGLLLGIVVGFYELIKTVSGK